MNRRRHDEDMPNEKRQVSRVVDALREQIASSELPPGTKLVELDQARDFGVSRVVIRGAFSVLEQRGLLERIKNRGAYVAKYDFDQIMQLWDIREVLTTLGYRLAARNAPDQAWDDMIERFGTAMDSVVAEQGRQGPSAMPSSSSTISSPTMPAMIFSSRFWNRSSISPRSC